MSLPFYQNIKLMESQKYKVEEEYNCWDSIFKKDSCFITHRIKYDKKGRITKFEKYDDDSGKLYYTIEYDWISDTVSLTTVLYSKKYSSEKEIPYEFDIYGNFTYLPYYLKDPIKNLFYNKIKIQFNSKYIVKTEAYFDSLRNPCLVYFNNNLLGISDRRIKYETYDTAYNDKKIKTIHYFAQYDSSSTYDKYSDSYSISPAYTVTNDLKFVYDERGRVVELISVFNNSTTAVDTVISKYIYFDSVRLKTILNGSENGGYYYARIDFYYNDKGVLTKKVYDRYIGDGLIDGEYLYNKDQTIHKHSFFIGSTSKILLCEDIYKDGLIQQTKYYTDGIRNNSGTFYIYK
jgi:hypothetical protein